MHIDSLLFIEQYYACTIQSCNIYKIFDLKKSNNKIKSYIGIKKMKLFLILKNLHCVQVIKQQCI